MSVSWNVIFGVFFIIVIVIALSGVAFIFIGQFQQWVRKQIWKLTSLIKRMHKEIILIKKLHRATKNNFNSHSVELVFQSFIHFYETNFKDLENWEFLHDVFPEGKKDLMKLYKWLKQIRPENYLEMKNLCFNSKQQEFEYWGASYQGFKFKINNNDRVQINPLEAIQASNRENVFERNMLKLQNALYNLDTQKVSWIIERRKYIGI